MNLLNNNSRGALLARILLRAPIAAAGLGAILAATAVAAPSPKDVTLDEPISVEIVNEAPVVVEVVNDVLKTPYYMGLPSFILDGSVFAESELKLVPEGKRFVVESVTAFARTPTGQYPSVSLSLLPLDGAPSDAQQGHLELLLQAQGTFDVGGDTIYWKGTYPLKVLVDSNRHGIQASITRSSSTSAGLFSVNLVGYLEDL